MALITLTPEQIRNVSSTYLSEGRKQDEWEITHVEIQGDDLYARVRMKNYFQSPTDTRGFHLTSFSVLEFLSQLFVVYGHVRAGLQTKTQEGWMMESSIVCKKAIRDPENIEVRLKVELHKKVGARMLGEINARVTDGRGLFEARIKAILA